MRVCAFFLALSLAASVSASAQSLADLARKESERRQSIPDSGKTYTNSDLKPVPASPEPADASAAGQPAAAGAADAGKASGAAQSPSASSDDTDKAGDSGSADKATADKAAADDKTVVKDEAYWSGRMRDLRAQLERDQTFMDALQSRINALTTDYVNRDDPAQRRQIGIDREKALSELDRVRKAVEDDTRAIPALEEEARRAGVPAGWLR